MILSNRTCWKIWDKINFDGKGSLSHYFPTEKGLFSFFKLNVLRKRNVFSNFSEGNILISSTVLTHLVQFAMRKRQSRISQSPTRAIVDLFWIKFFPRGRFHCLAYIYSDTMQLLLWQCCSVGVTWLQLHVKSSLNCLIYHCSYCYFQDKFHDSRWLDGHNLNIRGPVFMKRKWHSLYSPSCRYFYNMDYIGKDEAGLPSIRRSNNTSSSHTLRVST